MPRWRPRGRESRAAASRWWPARCAISRSVRPRPAREVKSLIGASVDKVGQGSASVGSAGQTMREIVASVESVSTLIGSIKVASGEQSSGIDQINLAVSQLDQMTQQNAALVEESAAAADSLRRQAATLAAGVKSFQLGTGGGSSGSRVPSVSPAPKPKSAARAAAAPVARTAATPVSAPVSRPAPPPPPAAERKAAPAPAPVAETGSTEQWESF